MKKKVKFVCFGLMLILIGMVALIWHTVGKDDITEKDFNTYIDYDNQFLDKEVEYLDNKGYVTSDNISRLLEEEEKIIKKGIKKGDIKEYTREPDNIYIKFSIGINYLFAPVEEGMLNNGENGKILTVEPVASTYSVNRSYLLNFIDKYANEFEYTGSFKPSGNANLIKTNYDNIYEYNDIALSKGSNVHEYALKDTEITIDSFKKWANSKIIIFEGHGAYDSKLHSCLSTGQSFLGFKEFSRYKEDIKKENIVLSSFPEIGETGIPYSPVRQYCITSKFVDNYFGKMDNSLIFLGACNSMKDDVLARALVDKGAAIVLGYTDSTSMQYEMMTRTMFFYALSYIDGENESITVTQALNYAKNTIGQSDPWGKTNAKLECFSKNKIADRYALDGIKKALIEKKESNQEKKSDIEISEYFGTYTQLKDLLSMEPAEHLQFPSSETYMIDQFYVEWADKNLIMKNEGASYVKFYGLSLGDSIDAVNTVLEENNWINCGNLDSKYSYVTILDDVPYYVSFEVDSNSNIINWYLMNYPESEGGRGETGRRGKMEEAFAKLRGESEENQEDDSSSNATISEPLQQEKYEYANGEFLSTFSIDESKNASLEFWHNYGDSASDEDFFFEWEEGKYEYELVGNRSRQRFKLNFERTDAGMKVSATCLDGEYFSWQTGQNSTEWINVEYIKK